jgi:hypothetical protein
VNSPLGKYSQIVAAGIAVAIIGTYLLSLILGRQMDIDQTSIDRLSTLALIALGAVFGSAATINGVKGPLDSAHNRIDKLETATGVPTHGSYPVPPVEPVVDVARKRK